MNALLALLLKDRISAFTYVDRLAGLVRAVSREQAGETITIPVAIGVDDPLACGDSSVLDLVPDERYACMVYFEDKGLRAVKTRTRGTSFESRMRLVCWVNTAKLNGDAYAGDRILQQFIASFPSGLYNDGPFIGVRHTVEAVPERGKALFSAYTYPEAARQYLLFPFDAFAIELLTTLRVKPGCEEEVTAADAACWAPPANRRRRNPSEFSCDELNAPITGLSDAQKECIDGCGGAGPCETLCEQLADPLLNVAEAVDCIPDANIPEWTVVIIDQPEAAPEVIAVAIEGAGKADAVKAILCDPCPPCAPLTVLVNNEEYSSIPDPCGSDANVLVRDESNAPTGFQDGGTWRIPSVTVLRDGAPYSTELPGATVDVPSDCPACEDVKVQLKDSAGNDIGPLDIYSPGTATTKTAPDATVKTTDGVTTVQAIRSNANGNLPDSVIKYKDAANASQVTAASDTEFASGTLRPATEIPRREIKNSAGTGIGIYATVDRLIDDTLPNLPAPTVVIAFEFPAGDNECLITVRSTAAGVFTAIAQDGASGTITVSKNGAGLAAFSNPTTLAATDTYLVKRTTTTAAGWVEITGTYTP